MVAEKQGQIKWGDWGLLAAQLSSLLICVLFIDKFILLDYDYICRYIIW